MFRTVTIIVLTIVTSAPALGNESSNSALFGRPTASAGPCLFAIDSEHLAAKRIPETAEAMRRLGVDCMAAQTQLYNAETRRKIAEEALKLGIQEFIVRDDTIAFGVTGMIAASSNGNNAFTPWGMPHSAALQSQMNAMRGGQIMPPLNVNNTQQLEEEARALREENLALQQAVNAFTAD